MKDFSFITASHPSYIENLYMGFKKDPGSVDEELRKFFEGYDFASSEFSGKSQVNGESGGREVRAEDVFPAAEVSKEINVYRYIKAFRRKGHLIAKTNPIRERKDRKANLGLENFGLEEADLDKEFQAGKIARIPHSKLRDIIKYLNDCYASTVGVEFTPVNDPQK